MPLSLSDSVGVPPPSVTASLNATTMLRLWPTPSIPLEGAAVTAEMTGATVSSVKLKLAGALILPAASTFSTEMVCTPSAEWSVAKAAGWGVE